MPVQPIVQYPDQRLTTPCSPVTQFDEQLVSLIDNLTSTLYTTTGIGLSAPQIGVLQQVMVTDLSDDRDDPKTYINPEILEKSGLAIAHESCLSLPGVEAKVMRSATLHIQALGKDGTLFKQELTGMNAICMQHEIDHLQGKLFIERISAVRRFFLRNQLNELQQAAHQPSYAAT